ncbi:U7 snRNA-associated Sm-like protein LSm11 [Cyprinodon tularosa]|uniref:U7 snRNA-associated Sm-like protein LSm11 n=1 Tax=Cyprinodon tularosa TaxID=77115 RepID=UPI0018E28249|nr:U7 snRNA-associated Sm-like protein LSm11 [Cyprinodon tularosa]
MEEKERNSAKPDRKQTEPETESKQTEPEPVPEGDELNVCSERFDPLLALYSPTAPPLPFPNIKCFNNVAEYESFLRGGPGRAKPENVEKRLRKATKGRADPERMERLRKLMVNNPVTESQEAGESSGAAPRGRRRRPQRNVLTRMALCKDSPLGGLNYCVQEKIRVRVHIRTFKGLRGVCSGFIVAFDKFWNMAMVDVDETYREPLLGEALYHEKALTISRLFEKLSLQEGLGSSKKPADTTDGSRRTPSECGESKPDKSDVSAYGKVHTRHINQLFIRGENVILVNPQPL